MSKKSVNTLITNTHAHNTQHTHTHTHTQGMKSKRNAYNWENIKMIGLLT